MAAFGDWGKNAGGIALHDILKAVPQLGLLALARRAVSRTILAAAAPGPQSPNAACRPDVR